jgi:hypothetical protein
VGYRRGFLARGRPETRSQSGFADRALLNRTQEVAGSSPTSYILYLQGVSEAAREGRLSHATHMQPASTCVGARNRSCTEVMNADEVLMRAWNFGMDEACWTDEVLDKAERLLPILVDAGYAATDDAAWIWWFTPEGVARAEELEDGQPD